MFVAHLPAGYLLSTAVLASPVFGNSSLAEKRQLLVAGLIGSILPDFDIVYTYLVAGSGNHRHLPSHWPLVWLGVFGLALAILRCVGNARGLRISFLLLANVQLHFVLDTVAGPVRWLEPFDPTRFMVMTVPRQPGWWVLSYLFHATAWLELLIVLASVWLFWRRGTLITNNKGGLRA